MKETIQKSVIDLLNKSNNIALQWATGVGKSKAAIDATNYILSKGYNNILLIVAETPHKQNWQEEFSKWHLNNCNITIECYASLKKYKNTNWDLIIFDEAHHLNSDLRLDIIASIKSQYIILLSATLSDNLISTLSYIFGNFISSKVSLQKAIDNKILPQPKIYLIPLELDYKNPTETIIEEWGDESKRITIKCRLNDRWTFIKNKKKYPNIKLIIQCTQAQKYKYLNDQYEYWRKKYMLNRVEYIKTKWLLTGSKRKSYLGECKTEIVKTIINKLQSKRFICFCTNIEQAEYLNKDNSIHSKKSNSLDIIESFNKKEISNLFAVGMLQEGQNLKDIEAGIIIQLDNAERAFIQKFGRSLRAESPIQYILYYKNTRDEEYLQKNVLEGIDNNLISHLNIKEL